MRKTALIIIKKEFHRFFRDWRMIFTAIILPALLTYGMYAFMGSSMTDSFTPDEAYTPQCQVQNLPETFAPIFDSLGFSVQPVDDPEAAKSLVAEKKTDLLVIFPADFDACMQNYGVNVPNVEVYYNATNKESNNAYTAFINVSNEYEASLVNAMDINRDVQMPNLATNENYASELLSYILPTMLMIALFTGCVSFSTESIAGEKERGTIATLLVTPASRSSIAIGKVTSLSVFALLAGLAEFISCMLSIPNMAGSLVKLNVYGFREYAFLLSVIISTVLLMVSILSIMSTYAKNVKEATATSALLMVLCLFVSLLPMLSVDFSGMGWRFVPVLNSVLSLTDIFSFEYTALNITITCISNLVYMGILIIVLSRMFNSEKIMFNK